MPKGLTLLPCLVNFPLFSSKNILLQKSPPSQNFKGDLASFGTTLSVIPLNYCKYVANKCQLWQLTLRKFAKVYQNRKTSGLFPSSLHSFKTTFRLLESVPVLRLKPTLLGPTDIDSPYFRIDCNNQPSLKIVRFKFCCCNISGCKVTRSSPVTQTLVTGETCHVSSLQYVSNSD